MIAIRSFLGWCLLVRLRRWPGQAGRLLAHVEADAGSACGRCGVVVGVDARSVFDHRAVVVGADREQLMAGLAGLAAGEPGANAVVGRAQAVGKTVFVFPGQGSQWVGMGAELLDTSKVFADHMHQCDKALGEHVEWSLIDVIRGVAGAPGLDRVDVVQPALSGGDGVVGRSCGARWAWCRMR